MRVHAIREGQTIVVWELAEGQGAKDIGSSPRAHWYLPDCPDLLCQVEIIRDKLVVTELGEAEIRLNGEPAPFRVELANGIHSACTVGEDWTLVVTVDPPGPGRKRLAEAARLRAASAAPPTAGSGDPTPSVRPEVALKVQKGRTVEIIEATPGLSFGRDPANGYVLDHGRVSRFHAVLEDSLKGVQIRDLGSTHHTYVGTRCLEAGESALLDVGAVVRFSDAFAAPRMEVLARSQVALEKARLDPEGSLVGEHPLFLQTIERALLFAEGKGPISFIAERGTGKSALARMIAGRARPGRPFVTLDCGAIPPNLVESELFGHLKGAFTGAAKRVGLLQKANGGVILIDEIGDLPLELQPRLLRVLQEGVIRPVGSETDLRVDVFVIAATNRNLKDMVEAGLFREDLFDRLGKLIVRLPSLREYKSDIPAIAAAYLARNPKNDVQLTLADEAAAALMEHDWPGNVRELLNVIQAAVLLSRGSCIEAATIRAVFKSAEDAFKRPAAPVRQASPEAEPAERAIVAEALRRLGGAPYTQAKAAGQAVERAIVEDAIRRSGGKGADSLWAALGYESKNALLRRRRKWKI